MRRVRRPPRVFVFAAGCNRRAEPRFAFWGSSVAFVPFFRGQVRPARRVLAMPRQPAGVGGPRCVRGVNSSPAQKERQPCTCSEALGRVPGYRDSSLNRRREAKEQDSGMCAWALREMPRGLQPVPDGKTRRGIGPGRWWTRATRLRSDSPAQHPALKAFRKQRKSKRSHDPDASQSARSASAANWD